MSDIQEEQLPFVAGNIIAASAGTGKTYQLTSRFLALMALGEDPGAMVALTFTKKAAGEFRNRIFKTLAEGALNIHDKNHPDDDPNRNPLAQRLIETLSGLKVNARNAHGTWSTEPAGNPVPLLPENGTRIGAAAFVEQVVAEHNAAPHTCIYPEHLCQERLGLPENLNEEYFCKLLGKLVKASGRLTLSTLDSFFQRLVAANCFDVGLYSVQPVTGEDYAQAKVDAAMALMEAARRDSENFFDIFSDATGEKENNMLQQLQDTAEAYRAIYRQIPDSIDWANEAAFRLPKGGRDFQPDPEPDYAFYHALHLNPQFDEKWGKALWEKDFKTLNEYVFLHDADMKTLILAAGELLLQRENGNPPAPEKIDLYQALLRNAETQLMLLNKPWHKALAEELCAVPAAEYPSACPTVMQAYHLAQYALVAQKELLKKTLAKTDGIHDLMEQYVTAYENSILASGRVTFDDITALAKKVLERDDVPTETAQELDVRLRHWMLDEFQDTNPEQMDTLNTMLQDVLTSRDATEFEQDGHLYDARQASLFVVGDVKQSIYSFRGGTPAILQGMLPDANGKPHETWGRLMQYSALQQSFRSAPVIMDFVNDLFRGLGDKLPQKEKSVWAKDREYLKPFCNHRAATQGMPGYVRVTMLPKNTAETDENEFDAACAHIKQIIESDLRDTAPNKEPEPFISALKGEMSVGILVRKNEEVEKLYRYLQDKLGKEAPLYMVSDNFIAIGSPLGEWLQAFFLWLEHPTDTYRRAVVLESEAGKHLLPQAENAEGATATEKHLAADWQNRLAAKGYKATLQELLQLVDKDAYDETTARTWLQAAQDFDISGGDAAAWIRFIRQRSYQSIPPKNSIQIMTMHKSKGLEFDAVILPFVGAKNVDDTQKLKHFRSGKSILLSPGGDNQRQGIPELAPFVEDWRAERRTEEYNLLYVAVTRAKSALFLLLHSGAQPYKNTEKVNDHVYLTDNPKGKTADYILRALDLKGKFVRDDKKYKPTYANDSSAVVLYENNGGECYSYDAKTEDAPKAEATLGYAWCGSLVKAKRAKLLKAQEAAEKKPASVAAQTKLNLQNRPLQRRKVSPSKLEEEEAEQHKADDSRQEQTELAAADSHFATDFGTDVHACFEQIEWLVEGQSATFSTANEKAEKAVRAALAKPEIAAVFRSPHPQAEVYNEQDVDAIDNLDGQEVWVSGIIDRLALEYDADGKKPVRAAIYDYKTNRIKDGNTLEQHDAELKKHYLPQMHAYCSLITKMFTLPPGAVTATLIAVPSNAYDKAHLVPLQGEE